MRSVSISLSVLVFTMSSLLVAPAGCGQDGFDNAMRGAAHPPSSPPVPVGPAEPEAPPEAPTPPPIDVAGLVVGAQEEPVIGRPITLLDRRGKRTEVLTGEGGEFHVANVAPPYDVLIGAAPSGAIITPVAYLGVARSDPRLEVFEPRGPIVRPASEGIKLGVKLPPCRAAIGACWVSAISWSATGGGATASSYTEGTPYAVLEIDHSWRDDVTKPGEAIDVHVLVGSADYLEYAYVRVPHVPVRPGETVDIGMVAPLRIDATDRVTVNAQSPHVPEGWQWTLTTTLDLEGGGAFPLLYRWSPSAVLKLPKIPGATFRVGSWVQHPPIETQSYFHRSAQAWSGALPLGVTSVALDLAIGPELLKPTADGQMSRRGTGYAWDAKTRGLHTLVVADLARGRQEIRAYTSEPALALTELETLGLPRLEPGEHVLDLTTRPDADIDELTQPEERIRARRFTPTAPGSETYQRFRFVVTP